MNKKKIIASLVVAAIVACGISYYTYVTAKASTITENIMLPTNTPSNSDSSNSFNTKHTVSTSDNSSNNSNINKISSSTSAKNNNNSNANTQSTISTSDNSSNNSNINKILSSTSAKNNNNSNTNTQNTISTSDNSSNNITSSSNINNPKITIVNKYAYVVNCDNPLAIFKSPCDTSDILISVSGNKKVYVYNKLPNGWACVEYHGVKGYMIVAELIFL